MIFNSSSVGFLFNDLINIPKFEISITPSKEKKNIIIIIYNGINYFWNIIKNRLYFYYYLIYILFYWIAEYKNDESKVVSIIYCIPPSLSNSEKASLYSAISSLVGWWSIIFFQVNWLK